jgi:hypothetical protein
MKKLLLMALSIIPCIQLSANGLPLDKARNFSDTRYAKMLTNELKTIWPTPQAYIRTIYFDGGSPYLLYKWSKQPNVIFSTDSSTRNPYLFYISGAQFYFNGLQVSTVPESSSPDVVQRDQVITDIFKKAQFEGRKETQQMPMSSTLIDEKGGCFMANQSLAPIISLQRKGSTIEIISQFPNSDPAYGYTINIYEGRLINNLKTIDSSIETIFYYCIDLSVDVGSGAISINNLELVGWKINKPKFQGTCRDSEDWRFRICDGAGPLFDTVQISNNQLDALQKSGKILAPIIQDIAYATDTQPCPSASALWPQSSQ